jgi:hypothetical protein
MTPASVQRWKQALATRIGMAEGEIADLHAGLLEFCERHAVHPDALLVTWLDYPELTVRRRPGATEAPHCGVESFLIHNGINVFGDIVCVAGRPEDLAQQGTRFVPGSPTNPDNQDTPSASPQASRRNEVITDDHRNASRDPHCTDGN